MLSGKFPQISASDYIGKEKKPDALSPSHRAFSLWPLPFGKANFLADFQANVGLCRYFYGNGRAINQLDAKKLEMPVFLGTFFGLLGINGKFSND